MLQVGVAGASSLDDNGNRGALHFGRGGNVTGTQISDEPRAGASARGAALPAQEEARIDALLRYQILDTVSERDFDDLTMLASYICETPVALISLVDRDRQWFKSRVGFPLEETSRDISFCAYAILEPERMMTVPDAAADERFASNPLVTGDPKIRFYAGMPLLAGEDGQALGTLCVIDQKPRELSQTQAKMLQALARQVQTQLKLRLKLQQEERLSRVDPLTGAANRRAFLELLEGEIGRLRRYRRPMSVAYLDLDNLKEMNDMFGHESGDGVLRLVAQTLRQHLRQGDAVARMGGDEFAILFTEADEASARGAVERFRTHLLAAMAELGWPVTVSVGLVTCLEAPASFEEVIRQADAMMYSVKKSGKNGVAAGRLA